MSFEKTIKMNILFDNYGALLTERQQEVFKYYYHDDLSYQEIADNLSISRAAVHDIIKRTVAFLEDTENKLGFTQKYDKLFKDLMTLNSEDVNRILIKYDIGGNYE